MTATSPRPILELATQTVEYVRRAVGVALEYDSDTLPLLDHYLRQVPRDQPATVELVVATAGAYFGEVVVRSFGGRWEAASDKPADWRVILPTGLSFAPAGMVASAIARAELEDFEAALDAPPRMLPHVESAMSRMADLTADEYYSLCGRLDTIEHVHEVLVTVAAQMLGDQVPAPDDGETEDAEPDDEPVHPTPPATLN